MTEVGYKLLNNRTVDQFILIRNKVRDSYHDIDCFDNQNIEIK